MMEHQTSKAPVILPETAREAVLARLDGWRWQTNQLERWFDCGDFPGAVSWVSALVEPAEAMSHHPDVEIRYRRVRLALTTHDCGGVVTDRDVELAERIDRLWRLRGAAAARK